MDITPQDNTATQPISDDQELAKALAGVLPDEPAPVAQPVQNATGLNFEETPAPVAPVVSPAPQLAPVPEPVSVPATEPVVDPADFDPGFGAIPQPVENVNSLDVIKSDALNELRPLIDRVDLPAEEKFDTYLMLIRSTDDSSLIGPAHTAAQGITDEKRKAEALLDIIKEIDYLSRKDQ